MNEIFMSVIQGVLGVVASILAVALLSYLRKSLLILLDTLPSTYAPLAKRLVREYSKRTYKELTGPQKMDKALKRIQKQYKWFPASVIETEIQKQYDLLQLETKGDKKIMAVEKKFSDYDPQPNPELGGIILSENAAGTNSYKTTWQEVITFLEGNLDLGISSGLNYQGTWDPLTNTPALSAGVGSINHLL